MPAEDVPASNREITVLGFGGDEVQHLAVGRAPPDEQQELAAREPARGIEGAPEVPAKDVSLRCSAQAAPDLGRERRRERNLC